MLEARIHKTGAHRASRTKSAKRARQIAPRRGAGQNQKKILERCSWGVVGAISGHNAPIGPMFGQMSHNTSEVGRKAKSCAAGGPAEAAYCRIIMLVATCAEVARHTSRKVAPGGTRRGTELSKTMSQNNRRAAPGAEMWPTVARIWMTPAKSGRDLADCGQQLDNCWPKSADIVQTRKNVAEFDQTQSMLAECWSSVSAVVTEVGQNLAKFGKMLDTSGRY